MINYLKYRIKNFLNFNKRQLGEIQLLLKKKDYSKITNIRDAEVKIFSQYGEDGIIDFLLFKLNLTNDIAFLEIGTGDYEEANTRFLCETRNCRGLLIDRIKDLKYIKKRDFFWKNDIYFCQRTISSDNIVEVLNSYDFNSRFNMLSLDVDGIDYWILKNIDLDSSDLAVVEFNPLFGAEHSFTIPNINNFDRSKYGKIFYGASLKAMIDLMNSKNYFFVGANKACNNAFFINKKNHHLLSNIAIENLNDYTNFKFRELKQNIPSKNKISNLIKLIEDFEIFELTQKKLMKIKDLMASN
tara:strand:+ start:1 stop:897 length:897 start_codon:yes stop_codon:yes gene_type:complete